MNQQYLSNLPITKTNKINNGFQLVGINEVFDFVGNGKRAREEALISLIEGRYVQNLEVSFHIDPLVKLRQYENETFEDRTERLAKELLE